MKTQDEQKIDIILNNLEKEIFDNYDSKYDSISGDIDEVETFIKTLSDKGLKDHAAAMKLNKILKEKKVEFRFDNQRKFFINNNSLIKAFL